MDLLDTFPYKDINLDPNILNKLKNYEPASIIETNNKNIDKIKNKRIIIQEDYFESSNLNKTTYYFSQQNLYKCRVDKQSPYDYYMLNKERFDKINNKKDRLKKILKEVKPCTLFNITRVIILMKALFKKRGLKNIKYLDPSSGWGDRLIGAIALGIDYTGYDPSTLQKPVYEKIINYFNAKNARVYTQPFEKAIINDKYDVVFTSPPFYDYEIYTTDKEQSIMNYKDYDSWWNNFFIVMINKSIDSLNRNGYLCLYYEDKQNNDSIITKKITKEIKNKAKYYGILNFKYSDVDKIRKMMIWKKLID